MTDCPTCGQKVNELDRPIHDAARRLVTFNGETAQLGWAGNLIFEIMVRRHPKTTHWEAIAGAVWAGQDVDLASNFRAQVCYMRQALKETGIRVVAHRGHASLGFYWLEW